MVHCGYVAQAAEAVRGIRILMGLIPLIFVVLAVVVLFFYPLDSRKKAGAETSLRKKAAVAAFCRYFIKHSPETCFVAVDEADIPVGYILCTTSLRNWCRHIPEQFFTGFPLGFIWSVGSMLGAVPYRNAFLAHLHINLLSHYHRQGLGRKLMNALEQKLLEMECPGVSLCVSQDNRGAMHFYESCGFHVLGKHPGSVAYGKKNEMNFGGNGDVFGLCS